MKNTPTQFVIRVIVKLIKCALVIQNVKIKIIRALLDKLKNLINIALSVMNIENYNINKIPLNVSLNNAQIEYQMIKNIFTAILVI